MKLVLLIAVLSSVMSGCGANKVLVDPETCAYGTYKGGHKVALCDEI